MRLRSLLLMFVGSFAVAQITVGPNVQVSKARPDAYHREVVIAADPNHADRLIACAMFAAPEDAINTASYVSFDGGRTWSAGAVAPEHFADDPTAVYGTDGTVYFIAKTETIYPRHGTSDSDALFLYRSRDGGKTWDPAVNRMLANDRPFMAVDHTQGKNRGNIYIGFNEHIHGEESAHRPGDTTHPHTMDDFRNTVRLITLTNRGDNLKYVYDRALMNQGGGRLASPGVSATQVLADGTVALLVNHAQRSADAKGPTGKPREESAWLELMLSTDGGMTLDPATKIVDTHSTYNLANSRGVTGDMAVDTGTHFKDRMYVVWADTATGHARILFTQSSDRGLHWSTPKAIDGVDAASGDDFMPQVAVNKDGIVGAQWYDRRENPDNKGYYVRFTASRDGGETWLPSVRVSTEPNVAPEKPAAGFSLTGGDTAGITADSQGVFHAAWIDNRTGVQQVWTATVRVNP